MLKKLSAQILGLAMLGQFAMAAVPGTVNYSGRLTDASGSPVASPVQMTFTFWDSETGGTQLGGGYDYQAMVTPNADGLYSVAIGSSKAVPSMIFDSANVWLNVNVAGEDLIPRSRITAVGYAFNLDVAEEVLKLKAGSFVTSVSTGTAVENGAALMAAYAEAKLLMPNELPLSESNRATLIVVPGQYDLGNEQLELDAEFVDVVGLSSDRSSQYIVGVTNGVFTGVIRQTADDVKLENLTVECALHTGSLTSAEGEESAYFPDSDLPATVIKNCAFIADNMNARSMRTNITYSGTYENCDGGEYSFGALFSPSGTGVASGTFINCTGGTYAFGGSGGTASGRFVDCIGGPTAFGGDGGIASGVFTRCSGGIGSFGAFDTASGTFTHCTGGDFCFGFGGDAANGEFYYCQAGSNSFTTTGAPIVLYCIRDNVAYP